MERMLALLFVCLTTVAVGQDSALDRSKLPQGSRALRARVLKDGMAFASVTVDTLRMKAEGAKPLIALRHLENAVVIADSLKDRSRERDLLFTLAEAQERAGKPKDALASLRAAHFLKDSLAMVEAQRSASATAQQVLEAHDELQRLQAAHGDAMKAMQERLERALDQWRALLIGAGSIILLLLGVLVWALMRIARIKRVSHTPRTVEVPAAPVVEAPKPNALRPVAPVAEPRIDLPVEPADPEAGMLLALFHKRMPERLQALTDARDRGDHEKVGRVLATMRPQLAQHDGGRFNDRCARLIAAREQVLSPEYASDLHQLIADVEGVLRETSVKG